VIHPWKEGYEAFKYGFSDDENPYKEFTNQHLDWDAGWCEGYFTLKPLNILDKRIIIDRLFNKCTDSLFDLFNSKEISDKDKYWMLKKLENSVQEYCKILNALEEFEKGL
jgi:ribosome modulation factor